MPRKRRREKLAHRQLTWPDVSLTDRLAFLFGWRPPTNGFDRSRTPWDTWEEMLTDWQIVREDALEEWAVRRAEHLTYARAEVSKREAEMREMEAEGETNTWLPNLYEGAVERLAEEEERELPFAEIQYQHALEGLPLGDDEEEEDQ